MSATKKSARCLLGFHDFIYGGLPPMWRKCRRCGFFR